MKHWFLTLVAVSAIATGAYATHNTAGDLTYEYLGPNRYRITLITYTDPCAAGVDRCVVSFSIYGLLNGVFTDQTDDPVYASLLNVPRVNGALVPNPGGQGPGVEPNCTRYGELIRRNVCIDPSRCLIRNIYQTEVTFRGPGIFNIRFNDPFRITNILNMSNSGAVQFYAECLIYNFPSITGNRSPRLLNDPLDDATTNVPWTHNPAGIDEDGDVVRYESIAPFQFAREENAEPRPVPGYQFPDQVSPGGSNDYRQDSVTGLITWASPQATGTYGIAFLVWEIRNGDTIGMIRRDMAIFVCPGNNRPPIIEALADTCIKAGELLEYTVRAREPNALDSIYFYLNNGGEGPSLPFLRGATIDTLTGPPLDPSDQPLILGLQPNDLSIRPIEARVRWAVGCEDLAVADYQVDYYAHDDLQRSSPSVPGTQGGNATFPILATNKITLITVLGPAVTGLTAVAQSGRRIDVTWRPPLCSSQVLRYEVYRSTDSLTTPVDVCCEDGPGPGYELVGTVTDGSDTTFTDGPGLPFRGRYCYRVVTVFQGVGGPVVGCPSEQVCVRLRRDEAVLLNVDVDPLTTSATAGVINLRWRQPDTTLISASFFPRPLSYRVRQRVLGAGTPFVRVSGLIPFGDSTFTVTGLNLQNLSYEYIVDVVDATGTDSIPSSPNTMVRLSGAGVDRGAELFWRWNTGWDNDTFRVFRSEVSATGPFILTATTTFVGGDAEGPFSELIQGGLNINQNYWYFVEGNGSYDNPDIHTDRLINRSPVVLVVPIDTTPPCPPFIDYDDNCDLQNVTLNLVLDPSGCGDDITEYRIFFAPTEDGPLQPLDTLFVAGGTSPVVMTYGSTTDPRLPGCFTVVAVDSAGNEGEPTRLTCLGDDCAIFALPNVFTPNGDGINDIFRPINNDGGAPEYDSFDLDRSVRSIRCYIYDRTGRLMATSTDVRNLWDGTINGQPAAAGTYFYHVEVDLVSFRRVDRITRTGSVTLLR